MVYSEHTIQQFWQRVARCPHGDKLCGMLLGMARQ